MAGDASQIVVAGTGVVSIAPYGTTLPVFDTTLRETLDAAFVDVGFTTEDGVTVTDGVSVNEIMAWQSSYPVRRVVESYTGAVKFDLLQWSKDIFEQVLHGVVTEPVASTVHLFTPTRDGVVAEKSIVVDLDDGTTQYRWVFPRVGLAADIEIPLVRTAASVIPTEWGVIGGDALGAYLMATSSTEFDVA